MGFVCLSPQTPSPSWWDLAQGQCGIMWVFLPISVCHCYLWDRAETGRSGLCLFAVVEVVYWPLFVCTSTESHKFQNENTLKCRMAGWQDGSPRREITTFAELVFLVFTTVLQSLGKVVGGNGWRTSKTNFFSPQTNTGQDWMRIIWMHKSCSGNN